MRIRLKISRFLGLLWLVFPLTAQADIAVVVHPANPVRALTPRQVSDLYLGRVRNFSLGNEPSLVAVTIYEQPTDSELRESFFRVLNGMPVKQLNAYWARLRFSGEVLPPVTLASSRDVIGRVGKDLSAIGYVDAAVLDGSVKVVLLLKH